MSGIPLSVINTFTDHITQSGFLPVKPEESSSSDPDLPQGQDFECVLDKYEDDSPPRELSRTKAIPPRQARAHRGGKRPRADMFAWRDHHVLSLDSEEDGDEVNLAKYFRKKRVSAKDQVLICRSYASYVNGRVNARKRPALPEESE